MGWRRRMRSRRLGQGCALILVIERAAETLMKLIQARSQGGWEGCAGEERDDAPLLS